MNLKVTGLHLDITPPLREFIENKLEKISRHIDQFIDVTVTLSVDKLVHKAEVHVHLSGKDIHLEATNSDMYAAIDALVDKLDRQVLKYKEKLSKRRGPQPEEML
eukprot:TRINITY_DN4214_c0_g1_i1.p3 TRINITY_DN4214_c0_g1~~TRINITY_DN4214_c0_g1_i1.p3  ORF type:complete len:105 (+),score=3.01 TRINITY_DN4214_c0_g1_i1:300-614(+)